MRHERGWQEKIAARTARRLQANLRRAAEAAGRSSMVWNPKENDAFFGEPQEDAREPGAHADDAETMCVWCEERVQGACKSHYDTMTCTHRVIAPTAEEWDSAIEARAAELHEGCRMPMEQAREIAASEASPDWYARGQDWGLADALTNGQSGDWVLDDIARAFAAGAEAKTTMKVEISMDPELVRRVVQAETEVALLRTALPVVQDASAIPIAWASSVGWRANQLMSAEQYRQCLPKNRADFDVPLYGPEALENYRRLADENLQDADRFRMLLQQHKHWLGVFRCDPDGAPSDSLDHVELKVLLDQLIAQDRSA